MSQMILSKDERTRLQKVLHSELQKIETPSPANNLLFVMAALISDFEELENIISKTYSILVSGKEITELLNSLTRIMPSDVITKLHLEGHVKLIQNLTLLADTAQNLKLVLSMLSDGKDNIIQ